jgi:hypothetical protein
MDGSDFAAVPRDAGGRFAPGNPGRPVGAVGKASARVSHAILADFETHEDELLPRLRKWFVPQYVALISRLLPRPAAEGEGAGPGPAASEGGGGGDELALTIAQMRTMLDEAEAEAARLAAKPAAGDPVNNGD